jgi:hypothetical protein
LVNVTGPVHDWTGSFRFTPALDHSVVDHGVERATAWDHEGNLLDGWEREVICEKHGLRCPREVRQFQSEADLVVDPCGGGFTVAEACLRLSRKCVSCDCDPDSFGKGQERLAKAIRSVQASQQNVQLTEDTFHD